MYTHSVFGNAVTFGSQGSCLAQRIRYFSPLPCHVALHGPVMPCYWERASPLPVWVRMSICGCFLLGASCRVPRGLGHYSIALSRQRPRTRGSGQSSTPSMVCNEIGRADDGLDTESESTDAPQTKNQGLSHPPTARQKNESRSRALQHDVRHNAGRPCPLYCHYLTYSPPIIHVYTFPAAQHAQFARRAIAGFGR